MVLTPYSNNHARDSQTGSRVSDSGTKTALLGTGTNFALPSAMNIKDAEKFMRFQGLRKRAEERAAKVQIPPEPHAHSHPWATAPDFAQYVMQASPIVKSTKCGRECVVSTITK